MVLKPARLLQQLLLSHGVMETPDTHRMERKKCENKATEIFGEEFVAVASYYCHDNVRSLANEMEDLTAIVRTLFS